MRECFISGRWWMGRLMRCDAYYSYRRFCLLTARLLSKAVLTAASSCFYDLGGLYNGFVATQSKTHPAFLYIQL
jgi:hypothetical protein